MKKIELKTIEKKAKKIFKLVGLSVGSHTWYFTVLFFVTIFIVAIWIWWNCLENPSPSSDVVLRVEQGKENYTEMKARTEDVIGMLQESRGRFEDSPSFEDQRELFWKIDSKNPIKPIDDSDLNFENKAEDSEENALPTEESSVVDVELNVEVEEAEVPSEIVDEENKEVQVQ